MPDPDYLEFGTSMQALACLGDVSLLCEINGLKSRLRPCQGAYLKDFPELFFLKKQNVILKSLKECPYFLKGVKKTENPVR